MMVCNGLIWVFNHDLIANERDAADALGFLPGFLSVMDQRKAAEQLDANYGYGGNWRSAPMCILPDGTMTYPGDPPLPWAAQTVLRAERILVYPHAFVAVIQADGSFVVQRMD